MPLRIASTPQIPDLLPGRIVALPGRGEMFVRHHQHRDASRPTVLLLHASFMAPSLVSCIFPQQQQQQQVGRTCA